MLLCLNAMIEANLFLRDRPTIFSVIPMDIDLLNQNLTEILLVQYKSMDPYCQYQDLLTTVQMLTFHEEKEATYTVKRRTLGKERPTHQSNDSKH